MGATVRAEQSPLGGLRIRISLPVADAPALDGAALDAPALDAPALNRSLSAGPRP